MEILPLNYRITRGKAYGLAIAAGLLMCAGSTAYLEAQAKRSTPPSPANAEPPPPADPLGRETPRSAMMGFLKNEGRGDYAAAALYLQAPPDGSTNPAQQLKQLRALRPYYKGDIGHLSNDPNGTLDRVLPPGEVRAGMFQVGDRTSDVILVRVDDPAAGKIWLISRETVAGAAQLLEAEEKQKPTVRDRIVPTALTRTEVLGMSLAQWLGWVLSFPLSFFSSWPGAFPLGAPPLW